MRRISLSALLLALLLGFGPQATQAQLARQITFDNAIQIALEGNYDLKRSGNFVRQQETTVRSLRGFYFPDLNFSTNTSRNFGLNFDQTTGNSFNETSDRVSLGLNAGITVFSGFRDQAALRQARLGLEAGDHSFERQRQQVVFRVMSQFISLIEQREDIKIQEENLAAQQQLLTQIDEFVRVGSRPMSDLYQQQANTASAELSLLNAQRAHQLAEATLIQTLQLDPFGNYDFVVPEEQDVVLTPGDYDIDVLLKSAFDRRYDLRSQESLIAASTQGLRLARGGGLPTVRLSGNVGSGYSSLQRRLVLDNSEPVQGPDGNFLREDIPFSTQLSNNRSQSIGLSLQIPLFNQFRTRTQIQLARINLENDRLDLENLQHQIGLEVRQAYLDYLTDEKRLDVTEKQLRSAQQAMEAEQERYNVGASTLVELTQARATFVQAAGNRVSATFSFLFRKRLIDYYIGVLDPGATLFE